LADTDVAPLTANTTGLSGTVKVFSFESDHFGESHIDGFSGYIGEGSLTDATGVAAYTYEGNERGIDRRLFVAEGGGAGGDRVDIFGASDIRKLRLRREVFGPGESEPFGFGPAGAYVAVDPGNRNPEGKCAPVAEQACTAGHFLVYDAAHDAVDEFDASGEFLDQLPSSGLSDAKPTAIAIDRSGDTNDGTVYATSGADAASKLLAFGPLTAPSRLPADDLSHVLPTARAVATDSHGDVYVVTGAVIHVFSPQGVEIAVGPSGKGIDDPNNARDIAVDSTGKLYVLDEGAEAKLTYYTPSAYPPLGGTTYSRHEPPIDTLADFGSEPVNLEAVAINPANDHVFLTAAFQTHELDSAAPGHESKLLDPCFACGLNLGFRDSIAVDGATGDVYVANGGGSPLISVINPQGDEVLSRITGAGSPRGPFEFSPHIAADQSNGHLVEFQPGEVAREYDAAGGFVAEFGSFSPLTTSDYRVAVDNACALREPPLAASSAACRQFDPANGTIYFAYDDPAPETFDLTAFGPLSYGEPPVTVTGVAGGFGGGVTLNGTANPDNFALTECAFQYLGNTAYEQNLQAERPAFEGAEEIPCSESLAQIGQGREPVAVHADVAALSEPLGTYRFRLVTANKYGPSQGQARLFGPPTVGGEQAFPIGYTEATLRADIDPVGLPTSYRVGYLTQQAYEEQGGFDGPATRQTQPVVLSADAPAGEVEATLTGLVEGTAYRFRFVAENTDQTVSGPGGGFDTLQRRSAESCPNPEYRTGLSANLPDCRAYELVTPAQTNGLSPHVEGMLLQNGSGVAGFNEWMVPPRGPGAGDSLSYFTDGTLPGFDGNGSLDAYVTRREEGAHPAGGWTTSLYSPTYRQAVPDFNHAAFQLGVAADQNYSFWSIDPAEVFPETLAPGTYLRTPEGFEPVGRGSVGVDPDAIPEYISPDGAHVVFSSASSLEEGAPAGRRTVYERAAGSDAADVVSVPPPGASTTVKTEFETHDALYSGTSEDGSTIVFSVDGTLYAHREGHTFTVAAAPNTYAGVSADGDRVFYASTVYPEPRATVPAELASCDIGAGSCAGPGAQPPNPIGPVGTKGVFVNVSPDGSHVFFESEEALGAEDANENGEVAQAGTHNLYAWDAGSGNARFVADLAPEDFELDGFVGSGTSMSLRLWVSSITPGQHLGRAQSPTRAIPDGRTFLFQSHARLTAFDNEGVGEIYRYAPGAPAGQRLLCVSCNPTGSPPSGLALLQDTRTDSGVTAETMIPNVTDDGQRVFFESPDRLLPEDANDSVDVYEWEADGSGGCRVPRGCLSLISSGQGEVDSHIYSMSADGRDVFFTTQERLVSTDIAGSPSIYDAREGGGISEPTAATPCQGDACQGVGSEGPALPTPATTGAGGGNAEPRPPCPRGRHRVKGRCVKKHRKHRHHHHGKHGNGRRTR
jgi:hypothetical protein